MKLIALFSRVVLASLLVFTAGLAFGQSEDSALKMVKALRLGDNLAGMTYKFAQLTTTYRGVEASLGREKADALLRAEIAVAVPKYQEQWNKNLSQSWAPLMTPAEFDSVAREQKQSPYATKMLSLQDKAGAAMKARSEPLLKDVLGEVLEKVFDKSLQK